MNQNRFTKRAAVCAICETPIKGDRPMYYGAKCNKCYWARHGFHVNNSRLRKKRRLRLAILIAEGELGPLPLPLLLLRLSQAKIIKTLIRGQNLIPYLDLLTAPEDFGARAPLHDQDISRPQLIKELAQALSP